MDNSNDNPVPYSHEPSPFMPRLDNAGSYWNKAWGANATRLLWWLGIPLLTGLLTWASYWYWYAVTGSMSPLGWWRVDIMPNGLFDTYLYMQWVGAEAYQLSITTPLPWVKHFFPWIWNSLSPLGATLPELFLVMRWVMASASIWIGAWTIREWSGLSVGKARISSISIWLFLGFVLGMRPGVYSWYLPFLFLGLLAAWRAGTLLEKKDSWWRASLYSAIALFMTSLYAWVLISAGVWLTVLWTRWILRQFGRGVFFGCVGAGCLASIALSGWVASQTGLQPTIELYQRLGVFLETRMPTLANTPFAIVGWIGLFGLLLAKQERSSASSPTDARPFLFFSLWVAMFATWFNTPFTSFYAQNDHFIMPVVLLAALSGAYVWAWTQPVAEEESIPETGWLAQTLSRYIALTIAISATAVFIYILQQPLRLHLHKLDVYLIHLCHWLSLAGAAWFVYLRPWLARWKQHFIIPSVQLTLAILLTFVAWMGVLWRIQPQISLAASSRPTIDWILHQTQPSDVLCAAPQRADFYAAHTGRVIYPAEPIFNYPLSDAQVLSTLKTIAGAYDVHAAHQEEWFDFLLGYYRTATCDYGRAQHGLYAKVLRRLGWSEERMYAFIGCPDTYNKQLAQALTRAINAHTLDEAAFRRLCPAVLVEHSEEPLWHLPSAYKRVPISDQTSVWRPLIP